MVLTQTHPFSLASCSGLIHMSQQIRNMSRNQESGYINHTLCENNNKRSVLTKTLCSIESVALSADTGKRSWDIHTLRFIFRTNVFPLALIYVRTSQPVTHITQVTHTLVSRRWTVAQAMTVAGRVTQWTGFHTSVIEGHCTIQTWADMRTRGVNTLWEGWAGDIRERALVHVLTGEAITFETLLTGAEEVPNEVGT